MQNYFETLHYGETHPNISVNIRKLHYFDIESTDIYGDSHRIVKTEKSDVDSDKFDEIISKAKKDSGDSSIDADDSNITLDSIVQDYFAEGSLPVK